MGNDSPPHFSPNLQFNLQIKMPKHKSRSEMGLLNTLQEQDERARQRGALRGRQVAVQALLEALREHAGGQEAQAEARGAAVQVRTLLQDAQDK